MGAITAKLKIDSTYIFKDADAATAWLELQQKNKDLPLIVRQAYQDYAVKSCIFSDNGTLFSRPRAWVIQPIERLATGQLLLKISWSCDIENAAETADTIIDSSTGLSADSVRRIAIKLAESGRAQYSTETKHCMIHTNAVLLRLAEANEQVA